MRSHPSHVVFSLSPHALHRWADLGLFCAFFALYLATLAPGLLPADSGEYQITGPLLGVAHPPGFALYTLLSWLTSQVLFFLAPATALNALSAFLAALTLTLISRAARTYTGSAWAGLGSALFLGASTTFWAQAVTANIRLPTACATAWLLERLCAWEKAGKYRPLPPLLALALGLGVAHHASLAFIAIVMGLYLLYRQLPIANYPSLISNLQPLAFVLLPFLSWLYFPLRAGAFGAPPGLATWAGFWEHVLARGFAGDMFHFANLHDLPDRLLILGNLLTFQWTWLGLVLLAWGGIVTLWRYRPLGWVMLIALLTHTFVAITYRAPQTVEYLIPAYVLAAEMVGLGIGEISQSVQSPKSKITSAPRLLCLLLAVSQFAATAPSYLHLSQDNSTRAYAEALLAAAPPKSLILANWHWATPLWYLQTLEGQRPDVEVRYVYPRTTSLAQDWVSDIAAALPSRPVLVTSFYPQEFGATPYRFIPRGPAWQALDAPLMTPPPTLKAPEKIGDWEFLGYEAQNIATAQSPKPVALISNNQLPITFLAAWRTAAPRDINFFVQLLNVEGALVSQFDVAHSAARYVANEVLLDRYTLALPPNLPAGDYTVLAGAYLPDGTRVTEKQLLVMRYGLLGGALNHQLPITNNFFGSELALLPATLPASATPGREFTLALDFLALRPLANDYVVSVSLIGATWQWKAQSDATPANGAIPTLKWIAGSRITDRHTLTIPPDAAPGPAQLYVTVYEAFTQQPLPVFDPAPRGTTLDLGTVEIAK